MKNAICVVGMRRSGGSEITRLLHLCGLGPGPSQDLSPLEGNGAPGFESRGWPAISDALLTHLGGAWNDPPELLEDWEYDSSVEGFVEEVKAALRRFSPGSPWGWADPSASLILPFWKSVVPELRFVISIRNPVEIARSLSERDRMPVEKSASLWLETMRRTIRETAGSPRRFVFYEDFADEWPRKIRELTDFCGLEEPADLSHLEDSISGTSRRYRSDVSELLGSKEIDAATKVLYIGLRAIAANEVLADAAAPGPSEGIGRWLDLLDELADGRKPGASTPQMEQGSWRGRFEEMQRARDEWQRKANNLELILSTKDSQIDRSIEQVGSLQIRLAAANTALAEATAFARSLEREIAEKSEEIQRGSKHAGDLEREMEKLVPHLKFLDQEHVKKDAEIRRLRAVEEEKKDEIQRAMTHAGNLEREMEKLVPHLKHLDEVIASKDEELVQVMAQAKDLEVEMAKLARHLEHLDEVIAKKNTKLEKKAARTAALEEALADKDEELALLKRVVAR